MSRIKRKNKIIIGIGLLLLLMAFVYQHFADRQDVLALVKEGEPSATGFESLSGDYPSYRLWNNQGDFLGYAIVGNSSGYGGKLEVLTVVQDDGQIKSVSLLQNFETPSYLNRVLQSGILDTLAQKSIKDDFTDVDAVSGATITKKAIITAVQKSTAQIGNQQLGMNIPIHNTVNFDWKDISILVLMIVAIVSSARNFKILQPWILVLSVLAAFLYNYSLTYGNVVSLLSGKVPALIERPLWYILVPGILIITLIWGRNFYCSWVCPFGAVQEGVFKSLNLVNFSPSRRVKANVAKLRWPMLWLAAFLALMFNNTGIAVYEPFF